VTLQDIVDQLNLTLLTGPKDLSQIVPTGGYTSDLLGCVMAGAQHGGIWVTLQAHVNVVAVAALLDLSAVIITESAMPDPEAIEKASEEGVILFSSSEPTFYVVGKLWEMGLRAVTCRG
jgi:hypothetical protein